MLDRGRCSVEVRHEHRPAGPRARHLPFALAVAERAGVDHRQVTAPFERVDGTRDRRCAGSRLALQEHGNIDVERAAQHGGGGVRHERELEELAL